MTERYRTYEQALREILRRSGMAPQDAVNAYRMLDSLIEVMRQEFKRKPAPRSRGKRKAGK